MAQNTGGVFGPVVDPDDRSAQYRVTVDPDGRSRDVDIAQRLHYQHALSDSLRIRGIVASRTTGSTHFDYDFLQAELLWQITPDGQDYQTGLRFDARTRGDDRPEQIGVNWMNQWNLGNGWQARGLLLSSLQVSDRTSNDIGLGGRAQISRKLSTGQTVGLQAFSSFGNSQNFSVFKNTSNSIGPFASFKATDDVSVFIGALYGLTDSARDAELRLWLTRGF